jgi:hypothetical protein
MKFEDALLLPVYTTLVASASIAQVTVDGMTSGDSYGAAVSVQSVQTGFGDNLSE